LESETIHRPWIVAFSGSFWVSLDLFDTAERFWKKDRTIWEVAMMTTMSMERFRQRQRQRRPFPRVVLVLSLVPLRLTYPMNNAGDQTICHHRFEMTGLDIGIDVDVDVDAHECCELPLWILLLLLLKLVLSDSEESVR